MGNYGKSENGGREGARYCWEEKLSLACRGQQKAAVAVQNIIKFNMQYQYIYVGSYTYVKYNI